MDTLSIFKFWKTTKSKIAVAATNSSSDGDSDTIVSDPLPDYLSDEDDESFFELELTLPKFNPKPSPLTTEPKPQLNSKPQSPISILRSASPKLRIFMFGKKISNEAENDNFSVKFKIEDGSIVPKFTRTNSLNSRNSESELVLRNKNESKRFLSFSFVKRKKSRGSGVGEEGCSPRRTSSSSATEGEMFPSLMKEKMSRFKVKRKELGKSKSASAIVVSPRIVRSDYSCDGIESAILHCKRSMNSNRGNSSLSRCSSDPSHEKSITLSEDQLKSEL